MEIIPIKSEIIKTGDELFKKGLRALQDQALRLKEKDILLISSKVAALCQGRMIDLNKVKVSPKTLRLKISRYGKGTADPHVSQLVVDEADIVVPGEMMLTLKDGILIPKAGIDLSNAPKGYAILWPKNPFPLAQRLCHQLKKHFRLKNLGVVIIDSHCQPLRWGTTGIALAWAGFIGVEDARGQKDIYGKKLQVTRKAVADNMASGALLVMGEAGERVPFAVIRGAPVQFTSRLQGAREICVSPKKCLFQGIYSPVFMRKYKTSHKK